MNRVERRAFLALTDAVCAPAPPLPPVQGTDALEAFELWLSRAPRRNRLAMRAGLALIARRLTGPRERRVAALERMARRRGLRELCEGLRSTAAACYYGDARVMRLVGYDPGEVLRRAELARAERAARPEARA
jgi:hypothetical protein